MSHNKHHGHKLGEGLSKFEASFPTKDDEGPSHGLQNPLLKIQTMHVVENDTELGLLCEDGEGLKRPHRCSQVQRT